ncbi:hypothetical protein [Plantactinospora sp. GCM10030261]|uniref:hypothetical protein n=1 Tax=Plantactinospora sp. GCM10030261 TaxID=3273420 RepID=UPI00361A2087
MPTLSRKNMLVGLAAAGVLGAGIAAPSLAFAEDGTPSATPSTSASPDASAEAGKGDRAARQTAFTEALAKELGVPTDKVQAALEKVREQLKPADRPERAKPDQADRRAALAERLAQGVKDGKLTQEQADAITAAVEAGVFPAGGHGPGGRGDWGHGDWGHGGPRGDK